MTKYKSNIEYDVFYWDGKNLKELSHFLRGISTDKARFSLQWVTWVVDSDSPWIMVIDEEYTHTFLFQVDSKDCCYLVLGKGLTHIAQYTVESFEKFFTPITH